MRCSHCSKEIRPVVAVDIDGTLGNYHGHLIDFAQGYLGRPAVGQGYDGVGPFRDWMAAAFEIDHTTFRQIKLAYRQGGMKRTMPAYTDWCRMVQAVMVDLQCEVWLCTTRPYLRLDTVDPDTREWLNRSRVPYDGLLYDEDKYVRLSEYVDPARVIAVVDDLPEQYDAAEALYGADVPILRANPYNHGVSRNNVTSSADTTLRWVRRAALAWRAAFGRLEGTSLPGAVG